jgi:hypothetical protein
LVVNKANRQIICVAHGKGRRHDFRLSKESKVRVHSKIMLETDTGYQGIAKLHANSVLPKKRSKKHPLTPEDKQKNRETSSSRVTVEHVISHLKRFKILSERYRNRRKRFALRVSLIAGICNFELFLS